MMLLRVGAHQSLFEPAAESGNADSGVSFVEAGTDSAAQLGSFSHVGKTTPDTIISEAIRLTDKKPCSVSLGERTHGSDFW